MKFDGIEVYPTPDKPWMLVIRGMTGCHTLHGAFFVDNKWAGVACSSGFDTFSDSDLTPGAYYIDASSLLKEIVDYLIDSGPTVNVEYPPLTASPILSMISFASIEEAVRYPATLKTMTQVSMDIYVAVWRSMRARIGRWDGNKVVWDRSREDKPN